MEETQENKLENSIVIYPNPATDHLNIKVVKVAETTLSVVIYNQTGTKLLKKNYMKSQTVDDQIDISALKSGMYIISICDQAGNCSNQRFIVR